MRLRSGAAFLLLVLTWCFFSGCIGFAQGFKGQNTPTHTLVLKKSPGQKLPDSVIRIGLVGSGSIEDANGEEKAAFAFLQKQGNLEVTRLTFSMIRRNPALLHRYAVIWFHTNNMNGFSADALNERVTIGFRDYLSKGGKLILSLEGFKYLLPLGLETVAPVDSLKLSVDEGYGRKLGFHAFKDHPVFAGMFGGATIMMPAADTAARITGYFGNVVPAKGKVVAVDWDYVVLRDNSKLVLEYDYGKGRVIAVGAYLWFSAANLNRAHLERFASNIIQYLSGKKMEGETHFWDYSVPGIFPAPIPEGKNTTGLLADATPWNIEEEPLTLKVPGHSDEFWDVAGERLLAMGHEKGGIDEVWAHPFMAFRDYSAGLKFDGSDSIYWLNGQESADEVRPECFVRRYHFHGAMLREIIVSDPVAPEGVIHYEYEGAGPAELVIRFKSNMRLMWPYSEKATGSLYYASSFPAGSFSVFDVSGTNALVLGSNKVAKQALIGRYGSFTFDPALKEFRGSDTSGFQVAALAVYPLRKKDIADIAFCAGNEGLNPARQGYLHCLNTPSGIYDKARSHCRELLRNRLTITSPDSNFNKGYRWALLAANRFFVNTPGMGKALVAGYSTTAHGWDGGQAVSGRPGYGWYFGRDGEWSSFAFLETGEVARVKSQLEFFQKYQDLSGKILHEATTSGVIHYDAADATPLYIQLAGRYFRYTNDTAFLRKSWPNIRKALDFCFSTDTDKDHLIENTNVGHGWVEGGELYGSHATLYLQGCWIAALTEASGMAATMNVPEADDYAQEAKKVKEIINTAFWSQDGQFYAYGMNKNKTFRKEPTILPAVPALFKKLDKEKVKPVLKQYASNAFSTNWGTRIIRDDSPLFKPEGYHYGTVWPLFTGWASLAEYAYGNSVQGYSHLMNNLNGYKSWGLGFVEEVLNGAEYRPSGVCPHQCWSETMVLEPAIEGMLGMNLNLPDNRLELAPRLPANWDSLSIHAIHAGPCTLDLHMERTPEKYSYHFHVSGTGHPDLDFLPSFPCGTMFTQVMLDREPLAFATVIGKQSSSLIVKFPLDKDHVLEVSYVRGIHALPLVTDPKPGDSAAGMRILSTNFTMNTYEIELENQPGTKGELTVYLHGHPPISIENADLIKQDGDYLHLSVTFGPSQDKYTTKTIKITLQN